MLCICISGGEKTWTNRFVASSVYHAIWVQFLIVEPEHKMLLLVILNISTTTVSFPARLAADKLQSDAEMRPQALAKEQNLASRSLIELARWQSTLRTRHGMEWMINLMHIRANTKTVSLFSCRSNKAESNCCSILSFPLTSMKKQSTLYCLWMTTVCFVYYSKYS